MSFTSQSFDRMHSAEAPRHFVNLGLCESGGCVNGALSVPPVQTYSRAGWDETFQVSALYRVSTMMRLGIMTVSMSVDSIWAN